MFESIYNYLIYSNYKIHSLNEPLGTTNIFDTSNCYHRDGVIKYGERIILMIQIAPNPWN
tara:strand:+ start:889 stop:1068 length:180 start_codon:yes stop_codon:yes gene_type:complete